jgi:hypothetical protein
MGQWVMIIAGWYNKLARMAFALMRQDTSYRAA